MKTQLRLWLLAGLLVCSGKAGAYLCYMNARLDHALYDTHGPKTVVYACIEQKTVTPAGEQNLFGVPDKVVSGFRVKAVILGRDSLTNLLIPIETTSFIWPEDLVQYTENHYCLLVLDQYEKSTFRITAVAPVVHTAFNKVSTNAEAIPVFETEILAALSAEKDPVRQSAFIRQVGPILSKEQVRELMPFLHNNNIWVRRAALAAIIYTTANQGLMEILANDIETFFLQYDNEKETIKDIHGVQGYAPYPYYLQYIFFIDASSRQWGSRWDEKETTRNQKLYHRLIATGRISKKVQALIEKS